MLRVALLLAGAVASGAVAACGSGEEERRTLDRPTAVSVVTPDGSPVTFQPQVSAGVTPTIRDHTSAPTGDLADPDDSAPPTAAQAGPTTLGPATLPLATVPATITPTTLPPNTVATTAPPTSAAATAPPSTLGAPVCDLAVILRQTETEFEGIVADQLACVDTWAVWTGVPEDPLVTDGYVAVASWNGFGWLLRNLGTAMVCTDAGVPPSIWPALGCTE